MIHIKNILIIVLLILANFLVYVLELESDQIALFILCITAIYIIYGSLTKTKCDDKGDSSNECLIGPTKSYVGIFDNGCLDVWHVKHMLLWFLIGMLSPNHILLVFYASVAFEISEHMGFKYICGKEPMFCGRYEDILINVFFYYAGSYVRTKKIIKK